MNNPLPPCPVCGSGELRPAGTNGDAGLSCSSCGAGMNLCIRVRGGVPIGGVAYVAAKHERPLAAALAEALR